MGVPLPIHGRGVAHDPPNRFESLHVERERWTDEDDPLPRTVFYRDHTRDIIATNDSPDVPLDAGINPYRGCEHGCVYCIDSSTQILMADGTTRPIWDVRSGDEIYGTARDGWYRRYRKAVVLDHWQTRKRAYRITLTDGSELIASADHRFLTQRGWRFVKGTECGPSRRPHLTFNDILLGSGGFASPPRVSDDYRLGYITGAVRGDGSIYPKDPSVGRVQHRFRLALIDDGGLDRTAEYLAFFGVDTRRRVFQKPTDTRKEVRSIYASSRRKVDRIRNLIAWPSSPSREWELGFLAGIFDAEGSHGDNTVRISNTDSAILDVTTRSLRRHGFDVVPEVRKPDAERPVTYLRIRGGLREHLRFFHLTDPAILRKRNIDGTALKNPTHTRIVSIEDVGKRDLFDITTTTGDFIANGMVSHNCYARPTHEYLGFSAGLDFETKIVVKENAAELLRQKLSSPRWRPRPLMLSGNTDPYQPAERRLRVTRSVLEVLAEFRNPVGVISKNHLVTRDIDLLSELAKHDAVHVTLSVTSLRNEIQRVMEPRTSIPARRIEAIRKLSEAGIPVGVNVAPVIPGLTDIELPAILEAAAKAGARSAAYIVVRLPHGVKELFETWLEQHFPDRKEKVLNRLRSMHDGALYDSSWGRRKRGEGAYADQLEDLFQVAKRKFGLDCEGREMSVAAFRRPAPGGQVELFD